MTEQTGGQTQDVFIVIGQRIIDDSLYRIKAGTVINGEEARMPALNLGGYVPIRARVTSLSTATRPRVRRLQAQRS